MKFPWLKATLIAALLLAFALRFDEVVRALFTAFLAILFAIFLFMSARKLAGRTKMPEKAWIVIILLALLGGIGGVGVYAGDAFASQFDQLIPKVTASLEQATGFLERYGWGRNILVSAGEADLSSVLPQLGDLASSAILGLVVFVVVLVAGIFIAFEPGPYQRGLAFLAPKGRGREFDKTLDDLRDRLYRWTIGRLASMAVVFVLTFVGLLVVGSPLPALLALIAGLLSFIPNFGPIAATALAALVGLSVSSQLALWIVVVFLAVQLLESNLITPMIERRAVHLPAGFLLLVQTLMGLAFGILGLIVATPLCVAVITIVRRAKKV